MKLFLSKDEASPHLQSFDWPCDLLSPIERAGSDIMPVLGPNFKRPQASSVLVLWELGAKDIGLDH